MIPRYSREEVSKIWSDGFRYKTWLDIEVHACEAWGKLGKIPKSSLEVIKKKAGSVDLSRIEEIEKTTRHDVIAFLTAVAESVGTDSRFIHMGMTSSDVLDTAFAYQLKIATSVILEDIDKLLGVLKKRAIELKDVPVIGRSHGIHAEPTSFGIRFVIWYAEFSRLKEILKLAAEHVSVGKISGAVGTFANVPPEVEEYVCKKMGLGVEPVSTQIVSRDRHAHYFSTLALIASSIEKIATEIRHLQRTEVLEAEEPFTKGQKGSSAMPHKRNPVLSENLCGLARIVRANSVAAMENVALWHERDISHSSVERVIGPDSTILIDFMLTRLTKMLDGLVVYPDSTKRNLAKLGGLVHSQRILLALIEAGMTREDAYRVVQENAMKVWADVRAGKNADFNELLKKNADIKKYLKPGDIDKLFDLKYHLKHVDTIYRRVFK
ncbi:MAG: adenylosuccinate lyase [Deltaproteobacteria bacterium CG11_big_fil_rev_8_21_14_0_20_49_13]|nr:MAG: adenylosuccinate lyase [Deltaproteobacteria bacterium CG11_big_fil_rev_8_21_14_0_20_49_13]